MEQLPAHELWKIIHRQRHEAEELQAKLDDIRLNGCQRCVALLDGLEDTIAALEKIRAGI